MTVFLIAVLKLRQSYHDQIAGITWLILTQNICILCPEIHIIMMPSAHSVCPHSDHLPIPVCPYTVFYCLLPIFPTSHIIISALLPTSWYLQFMEIISGASLLYLNIIVVFLQSKIYFDHHRDILSIITVIF
jgi:hypothetical protein